MEKLTGYCKNIETELSKSKNLKGSVKESILKIIQQILTLGLTMEANNPELNTSVNVKEGDVSFDFRHILKEELNNLKKDLLEENFKAPQSKNIKTFAEAIQNYPKKIKKGPSLLISSKSSVKITHEELTRRWKEAISFKKKSYAPNSIKRTSDNKLKIELTSIEEKKDLQNSLLGNLNIKCEEVTLNNPHLIIKGISRDVAEDELVDVLVCQNINIKNSILEKDDLKLKFIKNNKNKKLYNAVLEAKHNIFNSVTRYEKINIDHDRVHVEEYLNIKQCFRCCRYGHTSKICKEPMAVCSFCAGSHNFIECGIKNNKSLAKCINCTSNNLISNFKVNVNHSATSNICTVHKLMEGRIRDDTDYGE